MSVFDVALQLNNEGTHLLEIGDDYQALVTFKQALEIIQRDLPSPSSPSPEPGCTTESAATAAAAAQSHQGGEEGEREIKAINQVSLSTSSTDQARRDCASVEATLSPPNDIRLEDQQKISVIPIHLESQSPMENSYVFSRALVVDDSGNHNHYNHTRENNNNDQPPPHHHHHHHHQHHQPSVRAMGQSEMKFLSAIIIFNMALLHDRKGIRYSNSNNNNTTYKHNSSSSSSSFNRYRIKSLRLYEMTYALLLELGEEQEQEDQEKEEEKDNESIMRNASSSPRLAIMEENSLLLLTVACLNNMSQVAFAQSDYTSCQAMLTSLQRILMNVQFKVKHLNEDDIRGLMLNIMMMHPPTSASAA